jgi:hypothetical protein
LKLEEAPAQRQNVEEIYFSTVEKVLASSPPAVQRTPEEEKLFLHANLDAAIQVVRVIEPGCSTKIGALAYLLAGYYENYFSDVQGLEDYVTIPKIPCGQYPHLTVQAPSAVQQGKLREDLRKETRVYAFAATPKETVQRISEVANRRSALELAATVNSRAAKGAVEAILESERLLNGIRRQPLVVGFTEADDATNKSRRAVAGWVLGPKFKLEDKTWTLPWNKGFRFEHVPMQHNLAFTISVPEWWTEAKITIKRRWRSPKGKLLGEAEEISHIIELPGNLKGITRAVLEYRRPTIAHQQAWDVLVNKEARLLISGSDLWRSTRVTLGGQVADAIEVLPSMEGIVATFNTVKEPVSVDGKSPRSGVPVRVWTSEGHQQAGTVTIHAGKPPAPKSLKVKVDPPFIVQDQTLTLKVVEGSVPGKRHSLAVQIFGRKADGKPAAVYLPGVTYKEADKTLEVAVAKDLVKDLVGPSLVQVQLLITETETSAPKATNAEKAVPFYKAAPKIAWTAIQGSTANRIDGTVTLTTPQFMEIAFPGFSKESLVEFQVENGSPLTLSTTQWSKLSNGTFQLQGTFTSLDGIATGSTVNVTPKFKDVDLQKIPFNPDKRPLKRP